jgi:hypothetical protein
VEAIMISLRSLGVLLGSGSLAIMVGACGSSKSDTKVSYDYTENGCPTGLKEFSSVEAMCTALKDDAANNYCAKDMRRERFNEACSGKFETARVRTQPFGPATPSTHPTTVTPPQGPTISITTSTPPAQPSTQLPQQPAQPLIQPAPPTTVTAAPGQLPNELAIVALPEKPLVLDVRHSSSQIVSSLSGSLQVNRMKPEGFKQVLLMSADSVKVVKPDMSDCHLIVSNFSNLGGDAPIRFTLMGEDPNTGAISGCLAKLSPLKTQTFTVQFTNVPVSPIHDERIPLVTLTVITL